MTVRPKPMPGTFFVADPYYGFVFQVITTRSEQDKRNFPVEDDWVKLEVIRIPTEKDKKIKGSAIPRFPVHVGDTLTMPLVQWNNDMKEE